MNTNTITMPIELTVTDLTYLCNIIRVGRLHYSRSICPSVEVTYSYYPETYKYTAYRIDIHFYPIAFTFSVLRLHMCIEDMTTLLLIKDESQILNYLTQTITFITLQEHLNNIK